MKNWKQYTLIVFMAFLVFTFIGCGDDNGKKDPCNCNPKDHLAIDENCGCGLADCDCTAKVYGEIDGIIIYRLKTITNEDALIAMIQINLAFQELSAFPTQYEMFINKFNEMHIGEINNTNGNIIIVKKGDSMLDMSEHMYLSAID